MTNLQSKYLRGFAVILVVAVVFIFAAHVKRQKTQTIALSASSSPEFVSSSTDSLSTSEVIATSSASQQQRAIASKSTATSSVATSSSSLDYRVGISVGTEIFGLTASELSSELDDIVALHIGWLRVDFDWNSIQPSEAGPYQWDAYDRLIRELNARHLKTLAILDYSAQWAIDKSCDSIKCPPADDSQFAAYAHAVVQRFAAAGVHDWEIWNEQNMKSSWLPSADPVAYTKLLESAYPAIHAADSRAVVIAGGLAPSATGDGNMAPITFLSDMYASGARAYFDAVAVHPYSFPVLPSYYVSWNAWSQMTATSPSIRSVMTSNGDGQKKIWMTEFGAPTGGPGNNSATDNYIVGNPDHVSESIQSAILTQAVALQSQDLWAGPIFLYTYKDNGSHSASNENFFGLLRADGTKKPAYDAVRMLLSGNN